MEIYFVLDENGEPQPCHDREKWDEWMKSSDTCIERTVISDDISVETHFLGVNQNMSGEPPLLFETIILIRDTYVDDVLAETRAGALADHARLVRKERSEPSVT
jgi:hypothetical protein